MDIISHTSNNQLNADISTLKKNLEDVTLYVVTESFRNLAESLSKLCDSEDQIKIVEYNHFHQLQYCFRSEAKLKIIKELIAKRFLDFNLPASFQDWQMMQDGSYYRLQLKAKQSVALLALDPHHPCTFSQGQKILQAIHKFIFPYFNLPVEIIENICIQLPLKDLGSLARCNMLFAKLLGSQNNALWQQVARNLSLPLENCPGQSIKEKIQNSIIANEDASINFIQLDFTWQEGALTFDGEEIINKKYRECFNQLVPPGYFLEALVGMGTYFYVYKNESFETQTLYCDDGNLNHRQIVENLYKSQKRLEVTNP